MRSSRLEFEEIQILHFYLYVVIYEEEKRERKGKSRVTSEASRSRTGIKSRDCEPTIIWSSLSKAIIRSDMAASLREGTNE
jgi:hypothetical protein